MSVQFVELTRLLANDQHRVRLVVREFYDSAATDLLRLERAAAMRQWQAVRDLAQRIHLGCLLIGELDAADAAEALGHLPGEHFADAYARWRVHIVEALDRAKEFSACSASH